MPGRITRIQRWYCYKLITAIATDRTYVGPLLANYGVGLSLMRYLSHHVSYAVISVMGWLMRQFTAFHRGFQSWPEM